MFGITLNKPATGSFFREIDESKAGIRVRILPNKIVQFKPVGSSRMPDAIRLEARTRGGLAGTIEGLQADDLLTALHNPHGNRFFLCSPTPQGWISLVPAKKQPSRFTPHFRVWPRDTPPNPVAESAAERPSSRLLDEIRQAKAIIRDFEEGRETKSQKAGRPPREVTEAKEKLRDIAEAAREVLPVDTIRHACSVLVAYLDGSSRDTLNPQVHSYVGSAGTPYQRRRVSLSTPRIDPWSASLASEAASKLGLGAAS